MTMHRPLPEFVFLSLVLSLPSLSCRASVLVSAAYITISFPRSCFLSILVSLRPSFPCSFIFTLPPHPVLHASLSSTAHVGLQECYGYCAFVFLLRVSLFPLSYFLRFFLDVPAPMKGAVYYSMFFFYYYHCMCFTRHPF